MSIDAVIFDLDGTLWDSTATVAESWNHTLHSVHGVEHSFTAADIAGIMGCTDKEIEEKLFRGFGERANALCRSCMELEPAYVAVHGGSIYEGVETVLRTLGETLPLFIVSNCQCGYVEAFLSYSGYGNYFRDYEYLGRRGLSKRENIRLVMERHGLENCLYVGDTAHDEASAKAAGCGFIHAAYGFGSAVEPLASIKTPMELIGLVSRLQEEHCHV